MSQYAQSPRGKAIEEITNDLYAEMSKEDRRAMDEVCEQAAYAVYVHCTNNGRKAPKRFGAAAARNLLYCLSLWLKENTC